MTIGHIIFVERMNEYIDGQFLASGCGSRQRQVADGIYRHPCQHSIGYMGDGFYRSKDPTNSINVLKEQIVHRQIKQTISNMNTKHNKSPSLP